MKSTLRILALIVPLVFSLGLVGCLDTRTSVREQENQQVMHKQVQTLQQSTAETSSRFQDIDDEQRKSNGRIDVLENKLQQAQARNDKALAASDGKQKENDTVYREEFAKLKTEIEELKSAMLNLQEQQKRQLEAGNLKPAAKDKNPFGAGEEKFAKKDWQNAILEYDRYRKANPKGKQFATATYKTGVCFLELGMKDEAKAFFDQVIAEFPKSKDAAHARDKLKVMKKSETAKRSA